MKIMAKSKAVRNFIARPWILETIFFFLVLWQESLRLSFRTSHKLLPIGQKLQNFYYYYFGDFVNGYVMAYVFDGLFDYLGCLGAETAVSHSNIVFSKTRKALLATCISGLIISVYECTSTSLATTSDIYDIPAGILGAFFYFAVRIVSLRIVGRSWQAKNVK